MDLLCVHCEEFDYVNLLVIGRGILSLTQMSNHISDLNLLAISSFPLIISTFSLSVLRTNMKFIEVTNNYWAFILYVGFGQTLKYSQTFYRGIQIVVLPLIPLLVSQGIPRRRGLGVRGNREPQENTGHWIN